MTTTCGIGQYDLCIPQGASYEKIIRTNLDGTGVDLYASAYTNDKRSVKLFDFATNWIDRLIILSAGRINTFGAITQGTLYPDGLYQDVPLTGGSGVGATADIRALNGKIISVTLKDPGASYDYSDTLSADNANLGGAGSGFSVLVTSIYLEEDLRSSFSINLDWSQTTDLTRAGYWDLLWVWPDLTRRYLLEGSISVNRNVSSTP